MHFKHSGALTQRVECLRQTTELYKQLSRKTEIIAYYLPPTTYKFYPPPTKKPMIIDKSNRLGNTKRRNSQLTTYYLPPTYYLLVRSTTY